MAKLGIFTGTSPNDGTGDTLSQGAVKINSNFTEIYNAIGDGTNITNRIAFASTAGIATNVIGGIGSIKQIQVTGISTFSNGPVLIGTTSATGIASQPLQVNGGAYFNGSVGIGITNPGYRLDVQDVINIRKDGSNLSNLYLNGTATRIRYNDATGNLSFFTNSAERAYVGYLGAFYIISGGLNISGGNISVSGADRSIINTDNNALILGTNNTEKVRISSGGNVGIGTTNPARILDIYSASGSNTVKLTANGTSAGFIADSFGVSSRGGYFSAYQGGVQRAIFGVSGTWEGNTTSDAAIGADTGGSIRFYTNGSTTERARFDASGNLGIGITNPSSILSIESTTPSILLNTTTNNGTNTIIFNETGSNAARLSVSGDYLDSIIELENYSLGWASTGLVIRGNNVGIGITNPQSRLDVSGIIIQRTTSDLDTTGSLYISYQDNSTGSYLERGYIGFGAGDGTFNVSNYVGSITFRPTNQEKARFDANGNLLINNTSATGTASQPLQVNGGAYFNGSVGIGITNPSSLLSVDGSTTIGTKLLDMTGVSSTFTTVGNNTFIVPAGVTKISAVLIGGGGAGGGGSAGGNGAGGQGGGGGGLAYINDYPVTPGQSLTVIVGAGGAGGTGNGGNGGDSSITGIATAFGGKGGTAGQAAGTANGLGGSGTRVPGSNGNISVGGTGGTATLNVGAGGGGAAGYSGNGGNGGNGSIVNGGAAGSGGAGGGGGAPTASGSGGGGVGVLGQGTSGTTSNGVGNAGSGGSNGSLGNTGNGASGGLYGGGGGGGDGNAGSVTSGGNGAQGIVRIIWSPSSKFSRLFPTNQVGNSINQ